VPQHTLPLRLNRAAISPPLPGKPRPAVRRSMPPLKHSAKPNRAGQSFISALILLYIVLRRNLTAITRQTLPGRSGAVCRP